MRKIEQEIRFIDLFGGVGGFRLGLERASPRFKCVWYNDFDKYAVQTYNKNFKEEHKPTDIKEVEAESIPSFELLCGGFPCQSFSIAGKRKGFEDTRGTLFFEICRIIEHHRPRILFLENVKGLLNHDGGKTFETILQSLDELGYDVEWQVLNSKYFVPQNRERVFIVGHLRSQPWKQIFPVGEDSEETVKLQGLEVGAITARRGNAQADGDYIVESGRETQEIMVLETSKFGEDSFREYSNITPTLQTGGNNVPMVMLKTNTKLGYTIAEEEEDGIRLQFEKSKTARGRVVKGASQSLQTSGQIGVLQHSKIRRLTPIECERLQGFPDNWTEGVSDTQRYKQMGNAVTVNVIEFLGKRLLCNYIGGNVK